MAIVIAGVSQKRALVPKEKSDIMLTREYTKPLDGSEIVENYKLVPFKQSNLLEEVEIGQTHYDLQSNAALTNRIYMFDDGTMAAVWTRGIEDAPNFPDRGSAYNYYDGTSWGAAPTERVETQRGGWPNIAPLGEDGEIVVSHNAVDALVINRRDTKGTGAWTETELQGPAGNEKMTWPRVITSGVNNEIVHVLAHIREEYGGQGTPVGYYRSSDGGDTWDVEHKIIEDIGPNYYLEHSADEVIWADPKNGAIAFCLTDTWHDWVLMKSTDDGDSWTKTVVWEHPYPFFDWDVTITTDTLWAPDGSGGMALDNTGKAHIVFGLSRVAHFEVGTTYQYWPYTDGIVYWNEDMPPFEAPDQHDALDAIDVLVEDVNLIGWSQDLDNNGTIDLLDELMSYRELGISTMADITIDEMDRIFVAYSSTTESYDNGTYNYKHVWMRASEDGGNTWLDFVDMTEDLVHIFDECIYPVLTLNTDENIHLMYNVDSEPGLALDEDHPYQENRILYAKESKFVFVGTGEDIEFNSNQVSQNFPNPASGTTYLNVDVTAPSYVKLELFNIMGKRVLEVNKGQVNAGLHRLEFDVSGLNSGVYFYTVYVDGQKVTKKMIVE